MSEVVPPARRTAIYGLDRTLEGIIAPLGGLLTGLLAEKVFGFQEESGCAIVAAIASNATGSAHDDHVRKTVTSGGNANGDALGNALAVMMCGPWTLCFAAYSLLHWTYKIDRARYDSAAQARRDSALADAECPGIALRCADSAVAVIPPAPKCTAAEHIKVSSSRSSAHDVQNSSHG